MNLQTKTQYLMMRYSRLLILVFTLMGMAGMVLGTAAAQSTGTNSAICTIYTIYNDVITIIYVLGLMLMILGGALYAGANLLPGNVKGQLQGYGMGMIIGGVIGIIIALLAPFIIQAFTGTNPATYTAGFTTQFGC